ncbi:cellulose biosynthesis cyclic di-GMP-binding regulatory protein BcsB [Pseudomonas frederiksbergensis]|nr:cellulose biosynthesis cyclic di-GMP-binding regulatory protein BcsB [Pseudomonas frederiksbergensis]
MKPSVAIHRGAFSALACGVSLLALMPTFALAADSPLTQAINRLNADTRQEREIRLSDLGIDTPIILGSTDARRELYLPVPAGVPLTDATLNFDASYLNGEGGRNTLLLSLDGYPVRAESLSDVQGNASATLGVDKKPRESGSVRLGIAWSSIVSRVLCEDERAIGNVLRIEPDTRLNYSYDASLLQDVGAAWTALPGKPGIMVAPGTLSAESYDAAWRLGVALERIGKHSRIQPFPAVQDSVDLTGLRIPVELHAIPAFASLNGKGPHVLENPAQIGALLMLGQTPNVQSDLAINDPQLLKAVNESLDALQSQIQGLDATAANAFMQWRERHINAGLAATGTDNVRLALLGTRPVLMIAPQATGKALALFSTAWNTLARSRQLTISEAQMPLSADGRVALSRLGGNPGAIDVLAKSDWSTSFPLGSVAYDGRLPVKAVVDVSAAPGASDTAPVASLFLNDYLIGAQQLVANGEQQRIEARIPRYALGSKNVLRVSFQRQPVSDRCLETPQAFPVSVLPTSHIVLDKTALGDDFSGMAARFAMDAQILVPQAYLEHPASSLPQVISVADAAGVSPLRAQLNVSADPKAVTPDKAFLAFELPIKDSKESVQVDEQGRLRINHKDQVLLDVHPLNHLASLQVVDAGGQHGLVYRALGNDAPRFARQILLTRGDVAILGDNGALTTFDTQDPSGSQLIDNEEPKGLDAWRTPSLLWLIPGGILLVLILLLAGRNARRNRQ